MSSTRRVSGIAGATSTATSDMGTIQRCPGRLTTSADDLGVGHVAADGGNQIVEMADGVTVHVCNRFADECA